MQRNLKAIFSLIFTVLLTTLFIADSTIVEGQTQTQKTVTYKDPQGRFMIQYPSTWQIDAKLMQIDAHSNTTGFIFKPVSVGNRSLTSSDSYFGMSLANIKKSLDKVTLQVKPKSLDQIASESIASFQDLLNILARIKGHSDYNIEILKRNQTTIGGLPALQVIYLTGGYGKLRMDTFVIKGDKVYTFVFGTPELQVPQTLPAAQKMLRSFQFIG